MTPFTTAFHIIPASAVMVGGHPAGLAVPATALLTSLAGLFAISTDTADIIAAIAPQNMPYRLAA